MNLRLENRNTYFFGDSIMAQDGKAYSYTADYNQSELGKICRGFPTLLNERTGLNTVKNFAVGGQGICQQKEIIIKQDFSKVEFVILSVGINDFSQGTPIGNIPFTLEKEHDHTFIGEYCSAMDFIYTSNPKIKVVLMTPLHRCTLHRQGDVPKNTIDSKIHGNMLIDYVNAIKDIGRFYSCPVADMYSQSGLNRFNLKYFTFEGVHPTNAGYEFIINVLLDALNKI